MFSLLGCDGIPASPELVQKVELLQVQVGHTLGAFLYQALSEDE